MNKLTKKLLTSIITLAFAFIALGTTTFAWFTLSNTVTVGQFEAKVTAGSGFEVSVDDGINGYELVSNYYSSVPTSVIKEALVKRGYNDDFRLLDLTSPNGVDLYRLGSSTEATTGFIEFDLKFRSPEASKKIYLGNLTKFDTTVVEGADNNPGVAWQSDATFRNAKGASIAEGTSATYYAADAARMSFTAGSTIIYESPASDSNTLLNTTPIENGSVNYYDVKTGAKPVGYGSITRPASIQTGLETAPGEDATRLVLTLGSEAVDGYYYGTLTVRIWIEGWDPDCLNAILTDILKVNLHFITE